MTSRMLISLGLSALVFGGTTVGCAAGQGGIASASSKPADDGQALLAAKALKKGDAVAAVGFAEAAVAAAPTRADHRALLGRSYLQAGRFQSAREALRDALQLNNQDPRTALNLTLAQIATGDWQAARTTLNTYGDAIPAADRGLALALAGDPATAVRLLTAAARQPGADAKIRQNLALALALGGQWQIARVVAATDMSPADVDRRMADWATFAQPTSASDQVATLLGVQARQDGGQPAMLALVAPVPVMPGEANVRSVAVEPSIVAPPASLAAAQPMLAASGIVFGPRREVVQPLPQSRSRGPVQMASAAMLRAAAGPMKVAATGTASPLVAPRSGEWFVQLGAFSNAAVARDAWRRMTRTVAVAGHEPQGTAYHGARGSFYRLSVGGFDRSGADELCRRHRAQGGACFVRREAGDAMARWYRATGPQLAST